MIAADSSALARFFDGKPGVQADVIRAAIDAGQLYLPPVVLTELLSNPSITRQATTYLSALPLLELVDGYWERAGKLRRTLLAARMKSGLADCLIAQSCIDNDVPLITYDRDFRHFQTAGLKLL